MFTLSRCGNTDKMILSMKNNTNAKGKRINPIATLIFSFILNRFLIENAKEQECLATTFYPIPLHYLQNIKSKDI